MRVRATPLRAFLLKLVVALATATLLVLIARGTVPDRLVSQSTGNLPVAALNHGWHPAEPATHGFRAGNPKPPGQNYTRALVMARTMAEDVSWIDEAGLQIERYIYVVDDPNARLRPPVNKGNEAMVYLTFIIDHYDALPEITLFMHAHRFSHHNNIVLNADAVEIIRRLNNVHVIRRGYVNLNCAHRPGCPNVLQNPRQQDPWRQALLDFYMRLHPDRPPPFELSQPCCSQFAVSRARIRATSRAQYMSYREWLLHTELSDYHSGRVWEYLWHVVFTGLEVHCPSEIVCYRDVLGIYFHGPADLGLLVAAHGRAQEIIQRVQDIGADLQRRRGDVETLREERRALGAELERVTLQRDALRMAALERGLDPKVRAELENRS